jgi:hypothetical protein
MADTNTQVPVPAPDAAPIKVPDAPAASAVADKAKVAAAEATEKIKGFISKPSGSVITIIAVGIVVTLVTAFALYWLISKTVVNQNSYTLVESNTPILCTQVSNCSGDQIPNSTNGVRSSLSFWIYINDISKFAGSNRHVFHRGQSTDTLSTASPYVFLDPNTSALYVAFNSTTNQFSGTVGNPQASGTGSIVPASSSSYPSAATIMAGATAAQQSSFILQATGITFPYIPLQRWVHVSVVVNEDSNGGTLTGYLDGQLVQTVNSSTATTPIQSVSYTYPVSSTHGKGTVNFDVIPTMNIQNINLDYKGNVYVGGSLSDPIGPGFSGLVSRIEFFNYDMNANDVYNDYIRGPVDSNLLGKLGLGVRTPIYSLNN